MYKSLANQAEWWYGYEIYECEYIPSDVKEVRDIHPDYMCRRKPEDYGAGTAFATKVKLLRKVSLDELRREVGESINLGTMVCWHREYDLGDKHSFYDTDDMYSHLYTDITGEEPEQYDHETDKDFAKRITDKVNEYIVILPLYLYDHSGISMSTSRTYPFDCQWDSMQVGWIYIRKGTEETEKFTDDELYEILVGEVETYNHFLI